MLPWSQRLQVKFHISLTAFPWPADILLAGEVAWSSGRFDRKVKKPLYARTGIREYWIVDLRKSFVEVYRDPSETVYRSASEHGPGATISPLAFEDVSIAVDDLLLPR